MTSSLEELLAAWAPSQRWFAGKGSAGSVATPQLVGEVSLGGLPGERVRVSLVRAAGKVYQVPLTYHRESVPGLDHALVGTATLDIGAGLHDYWVYDGPHDRLYVHSLLRLLARGSSVGSAAGSGISMTGRTQPGGPAIDESGPSKVLSGEQSNTSIIVSPGTAEALIVKVFRVLAPGDNPDVVVQTALAAAGCARVPAPAGWLEGSWPEGAGARHHGHLAFASEFLSGSEDAWRVATRAVTAGVSFAEAADDLGRATAEVHHALATALPTVEVSEAVLNGLADSLIRRVDIAVAEVSSLADLGEPARKAMDDVRRLTGLAALQRVHGDYHLGQVLHAPNRGWLLLDFEGEPLRPLAERHEPDLAMRDVAGMLRSFDYAARQTTVHLAADDPAVAEAQQWAETACAAFLAGYSAGSGLDLAGDPATVQLLRALELDKALYEVVYETRNRPDWVAIPMGAVHRLVGRS